MEPTRKAYALEQLRAKIASGELAPGERLSDFSQSKLLGISRTPVREAINMLVAEGLAEAHPHAGVFVCKLGRHGLRELYELREALESYAAALVAGAQDAAVIAGLQALAAEAKSQLAALPRSGRLAPDDRLRLRDLDRHFHEQIIAGCGNGRIMALMADTKVHAQLFANMDGDIEVAVPRQAWRMHGAILKAVKAGDSEAARQAMADHIRTGREKRLQRWHD